VREPGRTADPSVTLGMTKKGASSAVVSHSSQNRLEWGTQPLLTVKQSKKVTASQDDGSVGEREEKQQVLPLRFAPVPRHAGTGGMTSLWEN
jgi:hypothetical protein